MFNRLVDIIKQAIRKMVEYDSITDAYDGVTVGVSDEMNKNLELWDKMYRDKASWVDPANGIFSLGIANEVCSELARQVTLELETSITDTNDVTAGTIDSSKDVHATTRADYLNEHYQNGLIANLRENLEYGMAMGGMIIKPYVTGKCIYFDFNAQGEFIPLAFNDDRLITDVAFPDYFTEGNTRYIKIERHTFDQTARTVTIQNRAFRTEVDANKEEKLGTEIPLSSVPRWAHLTNEPVVITDVDKPLYGYFRVPRANNIDVKSPLGVSVFSRAVGVIERADHQYSRLDWEYEGGQMAIDVDPLAIDPKNPNYFRSLLPETHKRLFRGIDLGSEDVYNAFAPTLRDTNYTNGLNTYLIRVEDLCELSRGTISNANNDARTATELIILRNRAFNNVKDNQKALQKAIEGAIYGANKLADIYKLSPSGKFNLLFHWDDSILLDKDSQLKQKVELVDKKVLSRAEVRAWYTGETLELAKKAIEEIDKESQENMLHENMLNPTDNPNDNNKDNKDKDGKNVSDAMHLQNSVADPQGVKKK